MRHTLQYHEAQRHGMVQRHPQPRVEESTPEKAIRYVKVAQDVVGVAASIYQGARLVAPYVGAAAAAVL